MATTVETLPEWLPDEYQHIQVTPEEIRQALDRDAQQHFGLTADEFLAIYRDPPERHRGNPEFRSLTYSPSSLPSRSRPRSRRAA